MSTDEPGFYLILGGLAALLLISEGLGLSKMEYNGVLDLLLKMISKRFLNKSEAL